MTLNPIKPIGTFLKTDENGFLINTTSLENIRGEWKKAVDDIVAAYKKHFDTLLHGVYVRGSVAKGTTIPYVSDIDITGVVTCENDVVDRTWVKDFRIQFMKTHPFVSDVEMYIRPLHELRPPFPLMIQSQSVCVHGIDLSKEIAPFKVGKDTAQHTQEIARNIEWLHTLLTEKEQESAFVQEKCTWIMKRLLRTGAELVMERSGKYTRDLYPCYEIFSQYYPEKESAMREALLLAISPTDDPQKILSILENFGDWIAAEVVSIFGEDFIRKE